MGQWLPCFFLALPPFPVAVVVCVRGYLLFIMVLMHLFSLLINVFILVVRYRSNNLLSDPHMLVQHKTGRVELAAMLIGE